MNNLSLAGRARSIAGFVSVKLAAALLAVSLVVSSAVATVAMATPPSLGQTAATAIGGAESDVGLVQAAVIGVLVLLVIFAYIKASMRK